MKVYLIGYPSCGKTTLGKKVAKKLGYTFVDLDLLFEEMYHTTISDFFEKYGEYAFRINEQKLLHSTSEMENTVIATGGGTPCFFDNMDYINHNGISIYIRKPANFLVDRLRNAKKVRPLFRNISIEDLPKYIETQLAEREPYYLKAQIVTAVQSPEEIIQLLDDYFNPNRSLEKVQLV